MERRGEQSISLSMSRIAEMTTSAVTNRVKGGQIKRDGKERTHGHKYKCTDCNSCKYKKDCTTSSSGRTIQRWVHEDVLETVYNETLNNNEVYKQRRCIVEHPFGTIKRSLGYNFFLRRRQENVDAEAASMFIAYNFKRLLSMFSTEELVMRFE